MKLIYSPISADEAKQLAYTLVEEKLVACANILSPHTAVYQWQGKVEENTEVGMLFKTTDDQLELAVARLRELHPYETPVITWWQVGATPETQAWLEASC
jgi:periplasmic divalent cation tolerance protein